MCNESFVPLANTLLGLDDSKNPYQRVGLFLDPCYVYRVLKGPGVCPRGGGVPGEP